ncbi:MAG: serine/threonine protein kinase [Proteobacteria bacterium]|nr:serine/threonine protein kinase [Pseudomonadota bacterium]
MPDTIKEHHLAAQFNRLSPEQVLDAVEAGGQRCSGRFIILNSYENRVYQLELEDESWVVGKFYRPGRWSKDTILAEHEFLFELATEEIHAICPLEIQPKETIGEVDGIYYSIFPRVGGRAPEEFDDEQIEILGRLVARIHNVGARKESPHRLLLNPETYGRNNLDYLLANDIIPVEARDIFAQTVEVLIERISPLFIDVPMHRIHGDCHLGNLLNTPKGAAFLDFDDMVIGPAVQDVWMLVPSFDQEGQRQRELLIKSYIQFRDFDPTWLRLVEPLRALRFIHYATWIARRWEDPIFPRTFGHFGTLQYWQKEIQDLREQLGRMIDDIDRF